MDFQHLVADDSELLAEMLDRSSELVVPAAGRLEGIGGGGGTEALTRQLDQMNEGSYAPGQADGVEAIVLRFTRPVFLIQDSLVSPPADSGTTFINGESEVITARLVAAKTQLDSAIPSVGRIDLRNHRFDWVGTGWVVKPGIAVTNRHVAENFARQNGDRFTFRTADNGRQVKASLDWKREYERPDESVAVVEEVLWVEPDGGPDLAILSIGQADAQGQPSPEPISLMAQDQIDASVGRWVAVIGYPARSPYNDLADQQRIFDGIYNVKRVAPGTVMSVSPDGRLTHDATTLGGNSGSVIMDLDTGQAVGLHFGGFEGDRNTGVQAAVVASRVAEHA